jgi:fumarylacetoacetate (FAA) hydrolase
MMGPRDPIRVLSEDWGVDLEGEVVAIVGDVRMGAHAANAGAAIAPHHARERRLVRRLIPAELAKGFGFVNGKGANALAAGRGHARRAGRRMEGRPRAPRVASAM